MKIKQNYWNTIAKRFDTIKNEANSVNVDNIYIAWPQILKIIDRYFPDKKGIMALDYGCGTGSFCDKLHSLGFKVTGIDIAEEMIKVAKKNSSLKINYYIGDSALLNKLPKFKLITNINVLQFVEDIEKVIKDLSSSLEKGGLICFAVFNPKFIADFLSVEALFKDFDSIKKPTKGIMCLGKDIKIPTYIRTAKEYNYLFSKYGFKKVAEKYPSFTKEFFKKYPKFVDELLINYPANKPSDIIEFLILGYKKI